MRRDGLWHPELLRVIASLGHGEELVIADPGLPIGANPRIDLVWAPGEPRFLPVLEAVLTEMVVERAFLAEETTDPVLLDALRSVLGGIATERLTHEQLKARVATATAVVRTGETTPFANVVLRGGVPF